jgi:hypothetical protein
VEGLVVAVVDCRIQDIVVEDLVVYYYILPSGKLEKD